MSAFQISAAGVERVAELEPLWAAMHVHHGEIAEHMAPTRDVADSWQRRRKQYEQWLAEDCAWLLIAEREGTAIGYAVVRVEEGPPTWAVGELVAELESLAVLPAARNGGVGAALVAAAREIATAAGAPRMAVGVAHTNADALRFYAREGFAPFYVLLLDRPDGAG
ncbi:MAG TPA: GNAT family N-acetyltransferase [Solirubrobacteraceae bacterium]